MMETVQVGRLEGFFHVARTGGYARAAREFPYPITQPAVHQQVRKLEAELGVTLFVRAAKDRMALTAEGRALHEFVKPFFEGLPGIVRGLRQGTFGGILTVHAGGLLLRKLLPGWIRRLGREHPSIRVDLHEAEEPAIPLLRAGGTDLVIDYVPVAPPDVTCVQIGWTYGFIVVPAAQTKGRRGGWALADLSDQTFISYPPGSAPFGLQMALLERHRVAPVRTLSAGSADSILGFVEAGAGWSIIPWLDPAGPKSSLLEIRPVDPPRGRFPIHAAFRTHDAESPLITAALKAAGGPAGKAS